MIEKYEIIFNELDGFDTSINKKNKIIVLNKSDLINDNDMKKVIKKFKSKYNHKVFLVSTITGSGIDELKSYVVKLEKKYED